MFPSSGRAESTLNAIWRLLLRLTLIASIIYAGYRLRAIITTLFIAAIVAYVCDPLVEWLCRRPFFAHLHWRVMLGFSAVGVWYKRVFLKQPAPQPRRLQRHVLRVYATLYVFTLAAFLLWQGTLLVLTPFVEEFRAATSPVGREQIRHRKEHVLAWYDKNMPEWAHSDKVREQIKKSDFSRNLQRVLTEMGASALEGLKNIMEVFLLPVLAFYFLIDGRKLKHEFVALIPVSRRKETLRIIRAFNSIMRAFVAGQFVLCLIAGVVVGVGLALLHVPYPLILGVFAGITRAIPIIGPILGGIPIVVLTLATKGPTVALAVLGFFTFLHFAESKFIMPKLIGEQMELHPVVIIVVLLVGGQFGGILIGGQLGALLGMFFAAPIASIVRVIIRRYWLRVSQRPHSPDSSAVLPPRLAVAREPGAVSYPETVD